MPSRTSSAKVREGRPHEFAPHRRSSRRRIHDTQRDAGAWRTRSWLQAQYPGDFRLAPNEKRTVTCRSPSRERSDGGARPGTRRVSASTERGGSATSGRRVRGRNWRAHCVATISPANQVGRWACGVAELARTESQRGSAHLHGVPGIVRVAKQREGETGCCNCSNEPRERKVWARPGSHACSTSRAVSLVRAHGGLSRRWRRRKDLRRPMATTVARVRGRGLTWLTLTRLSPPDVVPIAPST